MPLLDEVTTSVLTASRALLAVVARSVAPVLDEVSVPQFRVLVLLSNATEPMRHGELAEALELFHRAAGEPAVPALAEFTV